MAKVNDKPTYEELLDALLMLFWIQDGYARAEDLLARAGRLEYFELGQTRLARQEDIDFYDNFYAWYDE